MKFEETKNFKSLVELVDNCDKKGDTLFAILGVGEDGTAAFTGDPHHISSALEALIGSTLTEGSSTVKGAQFVDSLLFAMERIIKGRTEASVRLLQGISLVLQNATAGFENEGNKGAEKHHSFDPNSEECKYCDKSVECLLQSLVDMAKKAGCENIEAFAVVPKVYRRGRNAGKK